VQQRRSDLNVWRFSICQPAHPVAPLPCTDQQQLLAPGPHSAWIFISADMNYTANAFSQLACLACICKEKKQFNVYNYNPNIYRLYSWAPCSSLFNVYNYNPNIYRLYSWAPCSSLFNVYNYNPNIYIGCIVRRPALVCSSAFINDDTKQKYKCFAIWIRKRG